MLKAVTCSVFESSRRRIQLSHAPIKRGLKRLSSTISGDAAATTTTSSSGTKIPIAETASSDAANDVMLYGSASHSLGTIVRHGLGDACIVLNVGGVEFTTLRSTVACNPVLSDHVARAEANKELTRENAIFIDRDHAHFGVILQYLRNKVEIEHMDANRPIPKTPSSRILTKWRTQSYMPQLPRDPKLLAELYVEATYYRIEELQSALQDQSLWTRIVRMLGWTKVAGFHGNPFVRATQLLIQARVLFVTVTGIAAGTATMQNAGGKERFRKFMEYFSWKEQDQEEKPDLISLLVDAVSDDGSDAFS